MRSTMDTLKCQPAKVVSRCMTHPGKPINVLVVDDMDAWPEKVADALGGELCRMGVNSQFTRINSFAGAAAMLKGPDPCDLLVTDISLSTSQYTEDRDGLELVQMAKMRGIPSIAMSATVLENEIIDYKTRFDNDSFFYVDKKSFRAGLRDAVARVVAPLLGNLKRDLKI